MESERQKALAALTVAGVAWACGLGSAAAQAHDPAALSGRRASALSAGGHPARAAAVLHRARLGRPAVRPRHPLDHLRAGQRHPRREAVRHRADVNEVGYEYLVHSIAPVPEPRTRRPGDDRRSGLLQAVLDGAVERLGDELRRAVGQRDPGPEQGCGDGRLRARHRRGRPVGLPPGERRRHRLGARAPATSGPAPRTATSTPTCSPTRPPTTPSSACRSS